MNVNHLALVSHKRSRGKFGTHSLMPLRTMRDLAVAYTPGVAEVSRVIHAQKHLVRTLTMKGRTVAIVSDGSAVLGLGNLGAEAALPVMEGKAVLFKEFGGVDAVPIVLGTQDTEEIIRTIRAIAPGFGGINLEDISAPRCFEIERRLLQELDIPVMHDDQHGTAIVILSALWNAAKVVRKPFSSLRIAVNGAGAAAQATAHLLRIAGHEPKQLIMLDSRGILARSRKDLDIYKNAIARTTNGEHRTGGLPEALVGADVFIGVSVKNVLTPDMIRAMAPRPIVFAMANPDPEIAPALAKKSQIAVYGTGRSDIPNQINNVLAFPGIFAGALAAQAPRITEEMKLSAARAIAKMVPPRALQEGIVVPSALDRTVAVQVAKAVVRASKRR